jgi:hypothetical protein
MEPSDYDEVPLRNILYFFRVRDYWRNKADGGHKIDQKMVAVQGYISIQVSSYISLFYIIRTIYKLCEFSGSHGDDYEVCRAV